MVYDLGGKKSVSEIRLRALYDTANGVFLPRGLKLEVSDNKAKWVTLKSFGPAPVFRNRPRCGRICVERRNGRVHLHNGKRRYGLFSISGASRSTVRAYGRAFDELTVMGKNGKCTTAGTLVGTPDGPQNLALDKPYTVSHAAPGRLRRHRRQGADGRILRQHGHV